MNRIIRRFLTVVLAAATMLLHLETMPVRAATMADLKAQKTARWGETVMAGVADPAGRSGAKDGDGMALIGIAVDSEEREGFYELVITAADTAGLTDGEYAEIKDYYDITYKGIVYIMYTNGFSKMDDDVRNRIHGIYTTAIWGVGTRTYLDFSYMPNLVYAIIGFDNVEQWDEYVGMFQGDYNLKFAVNGLSNTRYMSNMYYGCYSLESIDLGYANTSTVINMEAMFYDCTSLENLYMANLDFSHVTNTDFMFCRCTSLQNLDISSIDTTVTPIGENMFGYTYSLNSVTLGENWGYDWDSSLSALDAGYWTNGDVIKSQKQLAQEYWDNRSDWAGEWTRVFQLASLEMSTEGLTVTWQPLNPPDGYRVYKDGKLLTTTGRIYVTLSNLQMGDEPEIRITAKLGTMTHKLVVRPTFNPFADVVTYSDDYYAIAWAYNNAIVKGTGTTTYSPYNNCTRAQFCIMLWKLYGQPSTSGLSCPFKDLDSLSANNQKAVIWCYNQGIINGTSSTTFAPKNKITRTQLTLMLWKLAGKPSVAGLSCPFTDISNLTPNNQKAIIWAYNNDIDYGTGSTTFSPNVRGTRAQLTNMLYGYNALYGIIVSD
ncbi:MAG: S-layer homology domain-containing protein [Erysipelotrichaceae bacterium]|nr:S-layer homology domain-containing protein [Erysipelotrichaceae bacterium]